MIEPLEGRQLLSVTLASQSTGGAPSDVGAGSVASAAVSPAVSDDGRFVVFVSESSNLVPNDANAVADLFVRDRTSNETRLVSAAPDGSSGNGPSGSPGPGNARAAYAISGNGRYVVFASDATNLVDGVADGNSLPDYFVRDLETNTTTLVTATPGGAYSTASTVGGVTGRPAISDDGRFIAFTASYADLDAGVSDADSDAVDVFVRDTTAGSTRQLTRTFDGQLGTGSVGPTPTISADGRYVAFTSNDKLVTGAPEFPFEQVWVFDTTSNSVVNATVLPDHATFAGGDSYMPHISADGRSVAFLSNAADLVAGFVENNGDGGGAGGADAADLFLRDLDTNTTVLVSHDAGSATAGASDRVGAPSISADGRFVAYVSRAKNLVAGISDANDDNGNVGGEDVFFFDATTATTTVLSVNTGGTSTGLLPSIDAEAATDRGPAMSDDGRYVVFASQADDLVAGDANTPFVELFVRDTQSNSTRRVYDGVTLPSGAGATSPGVAANGSAVAFVGNGPNIIGDATGQQVYVDNQAAPGGGGGGGGGNNEELGTLAPTLFTELPEAVVAGARVKGAAANVSITNVDAADFNGPVTITLFASLDPTLDPAVDAEVIGVTKKLKIATAQSSNVRIKIPSFPQVADGNYVLIARLTSSAGNGVSTDDVAVNIAAPFIELSGTAFGALPATLTRGKRGRLSLTVLNTGNITAKATVPIAIAVSTDPSGAGATTIGTVNAKLNLKSAASRAIKLNFALPADAPAGTFFVVSTIDPANAVAEKLETNNTLVSGATLAIA